MECCERADGRRDTSGRAGRSQRRKVRQMYAAGSQSAPRRTDDDMYN